MNDAMTLQQLQETELGKELAARFNRLLSVKEEYRAFHDKVLEIVMYSPAMLIEPRYTYEECVKRILEELNNTSL